ncbi:MAG TPA: T9SS type A sorting domain-containing protein [Candidatus Marinimicrobia bacterium]|nr:T9SS type A sorting domain-containing protein [Candidatus Neomarinimicrobiota bacterium]HRS50810.1 T9SS type A sorting domain-containing protein [Candidatus Neomarinimicrobiota bacterium]
MRTKHLSGFLMALLLLTTTAKAQTWEKVYEEELGISCAFGVCQTKDNGFAITGLTWKQSGNGDLFIAKIDSWGKMLWYKIYQKAEAQTKGQVIKETTEGDLIILAYDDHDPNYPHFWLVKTNEFGDTLWTKNFGNKVEAHCLDICPDSGYILAGAQWWDYDSYLIKTDKQGNLAWEKVIDSGTLNGTIRSVKALKDGFVFLTSDWQLIKLNETGEVVWRKDYKTTYWGYGMCIGLTNDEGYILCGTKLSPESATPKSAIQVIKTDEKGNSIWVKCYTDSLEIYSPFIWQIDNSYLLIGEKQASSNAPSEIMILLLNETGEIVWQKTFPGPYNDCAPCDAVPTADNGTIIVGYAKPSDGFGRTYILKVDKNGNVGIKENKTTMDDFWLAQNYPNPFNISTTIQFNLVKDSEVELAVYNLLGEKVTVLVKEKKKAGNYAFIWQAENIASGVYFCILKADKRVFSQKLVLMK